MRDWAVAILFQFFREKCGLEPLAERSRAGEDSEFIVRLFSNFPKPLRELRRDLLGQQVLQERVEAEPFLNLRAGLMRQLAAG